MHRWEADDHVIDACADESAHSVDVLFYGASVHGTHMTLGRRAGRFGGLDQCLKVGRVIADEHLGQMRDRDLTRIPLNAGCAARPTRRP